MYECQAEGEIAGIRVIVMRRENSMSSNHEDDYELIGDDWSVRFVFDRRSTSYWADTNPDIIFLGSYGLINTITVTGLDNFRRDLAIIRLLQT